jgi:hypothetical protein
VAEIVIDEPKQLVRTTHLQDLQFTVDDVKRFNADVAKAVDVAVARYGKVRLLVDSRMLSIVPPEIAQHFDKPEQMLRKPEDRYALVVGSTLAKLQARRVMGDDDRVRTFLSMDAAEEWLLGDQTGVAEEAMDRD